MTHENHENDIYGQEDLEPTAESQAGLRPSIYVASLSDYNAGRLHGVWIDATQDIEAVYTAVEDLLRSSAEPGAEEFAIHDYEDFGAVRFSEYEKLETVVRIAQGIAEHGKPFAGWASHLGEREWDDHLDDFADCYLGSYDSMEDYAAQILDDLGVDIDNLGPEYLRPYIRFDLEGLASDLSLDVAVEQDDAGVHIFLNHE